MKPTRWPHLPLVFCFSLASLVSFAEAPSVTVSTADTVLNRYFLLGVDARKGDTSIRLAPFASQNPPAPPQPGDVLLLYQAQGAQMQVQDARSEPLQDPRYGAVLSLRGAGFYETVSVRSYTEETRTLQLNTSCGGLKHDYQAQGFTQVVWVPQYNQLTLAPGASLTAPVWNGTWGGIVALQANTVFLHSGAKIDVSGKGFRGGEVHQATSDTTGQEVTNYVSNNPNHGGEKGESVAGSVIQYDALGGRYGRGAPANGGGGGNAHNAAGGGGANGASGTLWTGQGVMEQHTVPEGLAWSLDPAYAANGNQLTRSTGGGRGGYSSALPQQDPLFQGPNQSSWAADHRRMVGGLGGHPLPMVSTDRMFFGGGGGAGDSNHNAGGAGGTGGGIVFLLTEQINGLGSIEANGTPGQKASPATPFAPADGPGGGGAGGTINLVSQQLSNVILSVQGGAGGAQQSPLSATTEVSGGGGGGGGGWVRIPTNSNVRTHVEGAPAGQITSAAFVTFPANGGTAGNQGTVEKIPGWTPERDVCRSVDLSVAVSSNLLVFERSTVLLYQVTVANLSSQPVVDAWVDGNTNLAIDGMSWSCATPSVCGVLQGTGTLHAQVSLPVGGLATFTVVVPPWHGLPPAYSIIYTSSITAPTGMTDANLDNNHAEFYTPYPDEGAFEPTEEQMPVDNVGKFSYTGGWGCNMAPAAGSGMLEIVLFAFLLVVRTAVRSFRRPRETTANVLDTSLHPRP